MDRLRRASFTELLSDEWGHGVEAAGHGADGGQIALPGVGWLATRKFPTGAGIVQARTTTLFVSRGVGTVYVPCRVNCPPEVAVLTLLAAPRADGRQPS